MCHLRSSALYLSSSCDDSPTSIASFLGGWRSHVGRCWSVLNQRGRKASGYGGLAVARRRGTGQSAARVPMRAAKTRKPPAASGVGSRLPQNSPASIYARVPFAGAKSVAARTTSRERRRGSSKRPCSRAARMTHACRSSTGSRSSMRFWASGMPA